MADASSAHEWGGDYDIMSDPSEQRHIFSVLDSFRQYRKTAHYYGTHVRRQKFYALPTVQWQMLSRPPYSYLDTLNRVDEAIDKNALLSEAILSSAIHSLGIPSLQPSPSENSAHAPPWHGAATRLDLDKARSTVHQLFRDWSEEGKPERDACYGPVIGDLVQRFPENRENTKVLIPGAGLGRLVLELCCAGFQAEGNEISYHQLFTSSFLLNHTRSAEEWELFPFALSFSNVRRREDQLRSVRVPDVHPGTQASVARGSMSMTTGDFCDLYSGTDYSEHFDAVATVFFVDTAPNMIAYIETVRRCLRPGGYWINVGPLLWHFGGQNKDTSDDEAGPNGHGVHLDGSFEPSAGEIISLVEQAGFVVELHEAQSAPTGYVQNRLSMLQSIYQPCHWVARKS